jgi:hypothetical protein
VCGRSKSVRRRRRGGEGGGGEDLDKVITREDSERFDDGTATNRAVRLVKY